MSRMILLTGGSACGKSTYAEELAQKASDDSYYIAAMKPYGAEAEARIARHRALRREKGFVTIERYTDMGALTLPSRGTALLECLCNLTANEMFDDGGRADDPFDAVMRGLANLRGQCKTLIVVTNDVGSGGLCYNEATRRYIRALGRINAATAEMADCVCELVCGIPLAIKGCVI